MAAAATGVRRLLRGRAAVLAAMAAVGGLAWLYTLRGGHGLGDLLCLAVPAAPAWAPADFALGFVLWTAMMTGMMLPTAAPMLLTFAAVQRDRPAARRAAAVAAFAAGYLLLWAGYSAAATLLQWALQRGGLLAAAADPMNARLGAVQLGGALFVAAGLYQVSALKHACLRHCRPPFTVLLTGWRDGAGGALRMGLAHGAHCLGCCWLLMALLFAVGTMELLWMAALTLFVFAERLLPGGKWIGRAGGATMVAWGTWLLAAG